MSSVVVGLSLVDCGSCSCGLGQAGSLENSGVGPARHRNWGAPGPGKGGCKALEAWLSGAAPAQNQSVRGGGGGVAKIKGTSFCFHHLQIVTFTEVVS